MSFSFAKCFDPNPNIISDNNVSGNQIEDLTEIQSENESIPNYVEVLNSDVDHTIKSKNPKKSYGKTYMCPLPKKNSTAHHIIKKSKLSQHVRESHKHLLQEKCMDELINEIKLYSDKMAEDHYKTGKEECKICKVLVSGVSMDSHLVHCHKVEKATLKEKRCHLKTKTEEELFHEEHSISNVGMFVNDFSKFMMSWSGGGFKSVTIQKYRRAIEKIFSNLNVQEDPLDILRIQNGIKLSDFIEKESLVSPGNAQSSISAVKHLVSYVRLEKFSQIDALDLNAHLTALESRLEKLTSTYGRKVKKKNQAQLREKLDTNLLKLEEVEALHNHVRYLKQEAISFPIESSEVSLAIGAYFSFMDGNASRPDVPTNATLQEFIDWKDSGIDSEFKVEEHKTNYIYGAVKVTTDGISELLLKFGEFRLSQTNNHSARLLLFPRDGFSGIWSKERKQHPAIENVTNTAYRKYIETMAKLYLSEEQQKVIAERLAHRPNVARQHYQATPAVQSKKAALFIQNLLANSQTLVLSVFDGKY